MKYLVLIYGSPGESWVAGPDPRLGDLQTLQDELAASGELVSAEGLLFPDQGRVARVRDGALVVTDGPFVEAKEQLAGFFLVEADDARARQVAGRIAAIVDDRVELRGTLLAATPGHPAPGT